MTTYTSDSYFQDERFPFFIDLCTIRKQEHVPSHTHDFVELVFVVEGSADHEMSGHHYKLTAGDVFVLEPNVYHSYTASSDEDTVVFNVLFDAAFLQKELEVLQQLPSFIHFFYLSPFLRKAQSFVPYHPLQAGQKLHIQHHLQIINEEFQTKREGYQLLIKTRFIECLVWLSRYQQENRNGKQEEVSDQAWMESIRHFVEQHYQQPLTLKQLSRLCGMSVSSFTAKFKGATGMSLLDFKHAIQIRHASEMLRTDANKKILQIALETGFNDLSFFNKMFRKHTGVTPREYRLYNSSD
ncbi:AraC family transcriptional regulator [Paenibacillus baekrokdamisoli]|uniref:AraC family transcriptional regulator n=1 Tax=Paenibacillus baekrokdamisoli TaxID=1712516 RepID=A0A3G9IJ46_9BACL|nr:AraC family transcriptional regulator [Paenibacillus baekrokdamisoli]MBB3072645.1 AraC-like DNA-binding protein/quercetin dioxygenase-like cupin family protein [Paenibacillus baekrokdamisoli]BBH18930.1 AraC family transcriptional regulator [Paenibacillus baekrokdamisoli]